jgi:antitoxin (DNA-binding transcriptional repressor) of toxin-antitoxin stability system
MTTPHDQGGNVQQKHVSKSEFKAKALEYFRAVEATGSAVIVTDNGQPTIEIRRYRADKRSPLERLRGSIVEFRDPTQPVAEHDWEAAS